MQKRQFLSVITAVALAAAAGSVLAQDGTFKIGLIVPLTGPFTFHWQATGSRCAPVHGAKRRCRGRQEGGAHRQGRHRHAGHHQAPRAGLVVNDKVNVLAGFGLTPLALATAPVATQSRTPLVVMAAATSIITEPLLTSFRTSFTVPQVVTSLQTGPRKTASRKW